MSPEGKVSVVVRSKRVPVRTVFLTRPIYSSTGLLVGSSTQHGVVYDTVLDEPQVKAIKEGKRLSCNLDLDFEVVDRAKSNPLWRMASRFFGEADHAPSLVLTPSSAVSN